MQKNNIALIKFSALGDLAAVEPFVKILSKKYDLTLVTSKLGYEYYKDNTNLKFIVLNNKNNIFELILIFLKLFSFQSIIDLQGNDRSKFLTIFKRTHTHANYTNNYNLKLLNTELIKENSILHLDAYSILDNFVSDVELEKNIPLKSRSKSYIVLNCGSSPKWISKRLPFDKWKEISIILKEKFNLPIYLTGDKSEVSYLEELSSYLVGDIKIIAGETNLIELKEILKNAYLTISTDSAAMHISAAQGTPTIGLFGATNWIKSAPFGDWSIATFDEKYFKSSIPFSKNQTKLKDEIYSNINIEKGLEKIKSFLN